MEEVGEWGEQTTKREDSGLIDWEQNCNHGD